MKRDKLRSSAEAKLRETREETGPPSLRYELDVVNVELAMQTDELERTVDELERTVDELERAKQSLSRLFELAPVAFVALGTDGRIVNANDAAVRLLQSPRGEVIGALVSRYVAIPDVDRFGRQLEGVKGSNEKVGVEISMNPGGIRSPLYGAKCEPIPVFAEIAAVSGDERIGLLVSLIDISKLHAAQASREVERNRADAIFVGAADSIVTINVRGTIETVNPATEKTFGYSADELIGKNVAILMPLPHRDLHDYYIANYRRTGVARMIGCGREVVALRKDGSEFPVHVSVTHLNGSGSGFCGFIRDLTQVKKAEDELRHAHKMEAIGTLASGVAHDFNNLLMGIAGCAEIAIDDVPDGAVAQLYLQEVLDAAASGVEVTRQLLTFSRREEGERIEVFKFDGFVAMQANMLKRLIGEDIVLTFSLEAGAANVRLDPTQLVQVLMNLAINARDAMPRGGALAIESAVIDQNSGAVSAKQRQIELKVTDTGCGMPAEVKNRIFDPFFTTKEQGKGTGLGLSSVYGIIKGAGGLVSVDSEVGRGTSFVITLPISNKRITGEFAPLASVEGGSETVLVVEDEPRVRLVERNYLEGAGYNVLEAADGSAALECIQRYSKPIDLLVTDMVLPGMSGEQIAREVRRLRPGIGVLMLSAHDPKWLVESGRIDKGANIFQKPLRRDALLAAVRAVLDGKAVAEPATSDDRSTEEHCNRGRVLVVEDVRPARLAIVEFLGSEGWDVISAANYRDACAHIEQPESIDVLLTDLKIPGGGGEQVAAMIRKKNPATAIVYMSGAFPSGALDPKGVMLEKPLDLQQIADILAEASAASPSQRSTN